MHLQSNWEGGTLIYLLKFISMSYYISYHHSLGDASLRCYAWEIVGIMRSMVELALQGHEFSNVTITKI